MPLNNNEETEIVDDDNNEMNDYDADDYGFIVGSDGNLKSIMFPEDLWDEPPKEIKKILKIFGIKDIHEIEPKTLH
jgi:hypothetical protein